MYVTSATLSWTAVGGSGGYEVDASSTQFVGGVTLSTTTMNNASTSLTVLGLNPDTTYYFNVGSLWNGATSLQRHAAVHVDLDEPDQPVGAGVSSGSVQVGWPAFAAGSGTNTAQGYELDVSSNANFVTYMSSVTTAIAASTLTVSGLLPNTLYYVRAGAVNWDGYVNFVSLSTTTSAGASPASVTLTAVYVTSATLSWTAVDGSNGYEVDASSTQFTGGTILPRQRRRAP